MVRTLFTQITSLVLLGFCFLLGSPVMAGHGPEPFPLYEIIAPNVAFWTKVYSQYEMTQGIVHDSRNLDIIYDIIALKHPDQAGAQKTNRLRVKRANNRIIHLLEKLAQNPHSKDSECRRIAALFGDKASSAVFRKAARRVRCQIGQKDRFITGLKRSGVYLDHIKNIFQSHGLPTDLAYLPHVESSFNTKAYSKFGAAGIWQFTRSTGKGYMQVGYAVDERRDPLIASHGAARLLKANYAALGSWPLAITAYNHGAAGMRRAKRKHGSYEAIVQSYRSRTFKFASRNFYSEFLAARLVAKNPHRYFGTLSMDPPLRFRTAPLEGYVAFQDLCSHFNVSATELKVLNPSLRAPVINGQKYVPKGYALRLPPNDAREGGGKATTLEPSLYHAKQKPSRFYTVRRGDTAGRIAREHRVKLDDLIMANHLNRRATIYPRQTLRIPLPGESVPEAKAQETDVPPPAPKTLPETHPAVLMAAAAPVVAVDASTEPQEKSTPGVGLETLNKDPEDINPEIVIADIQILKSYEHEGRPVGLIQVEVEETLGHYAEWLNVRARELRRLNGLRYGHMLRSGHKIRIPLHRVSAQEFEEQRYEYHKKLQEDFFAAYRIERLYSYQVKGGDSYWTLCRDLFEVPLWLLRRCNPEVEFRDLRVDQHIVVPTVEKL